MIGTPNVTHYQRLSGGLNGYKIVFTKWSSDMVLLCDSCGWNWTTVTILSLSFVGGNGNDVCHKEAVGERMSRRAC